MPARTAPPAPCDLWIEHDGLELAVRDHGGDGPPLLLLHGAGRTLADWAAVVPFLTPRHRVVAMDLRAHGRSGAGEWTFPAVLGDVEAVPTACGVPDALPVGHSLGGMIAALCARHHPGTPAAVNLDGHGMGTPAQYPGLDPARVAQRLDQAREFAANAIGRTFPAEALEEVRGGQLAMGRALGIPEHLLDAGVRRALAEDAGGRLYLRPEREAGRRMLAEMDALDLFALYRAVRRPLLICRARRRNPVVPGLEWFDELMAAYGKGLGRDLAELARSRPEITVEEVDATHAMLLEAPRQVAERILAFAARHGR